MIFSAVMFWELKNIVTSPQRNRVFILATVTILLYVYGQDLWAYCVHSCIYDTFMIHCTGKLI